MPLYSLKIRRSFRRAEAVPCLLHWVLESSLRKAACGILEEDHNSPTGSRVRSTNSGAHRKLFTEDSSMFHNLKILGLALHLFCSSNHTSHYDIKTFEELTTLLIWRRAIPGITSPTSVMLPPSLKTLQRFIYFPPICQLYSKDFMWAFKSYLV